MRRFLDRVHALATQKLTDAVPASETLKQLHRMIQKVGQDTEGLRFNTAISSMMIFANHLSGLSGGAPREAVEKLVVCLSPYAPHLTEELWAHLRGTEAGPSVSLEPWPDYDASLCIDDQVEVPVQVNGRVRGKVSLSRDATEAAAKAAALGDDGVQRHLGGASLTKVVYIPGRIINLIAK